MNVIEKYKRWVRANGDLLSAFETGLSGLTWLLPERFSDNERLLEGLHTISNLFLVINEGIYHDNGEDLNLGVRLALNALRQVEVLVELFSIDYAKTGRLGTRYDLLVVTETLKMLLRISLYRMSQGRILLDNGLTNENKRKEIGIMRPETKSERVLLAFSSFRSRDSDESEGKSLCMRQKEGHVQRYWWDKYSSSSDGTLAHYNHATTHIINDFKVLDAIVEKSQIKATRFIEIGEISHIVRPLVYVSCLRAWGSRSWKPWLVDFALELGSIRLIHYAFKCSENFALKSAQHKLVKNSSLSCVYAQRRLLWSKPEMDELTRRKLVFVYFLIRDPFFGYVTRPIIERWLQTIKGIPLLSWLSEKMTELLYGVQKYHTFRKTCTNLAGMWSVRCSARVAFQDRAGVSFKCIGLSHHSTVRSKVVCSSCSDKVLVVYSKKDCPLCDVLTNKIGAILDRAKFSDTMLSGVAFEVRDIAENPAWESRHRMQVPVMALSKGDEEIIIPRTSPRVTADRLERHIVEFLGKISEKSVEN